MPRIRVLLPVLFATATAAAQPPEDLGLFMPLAPAGTPDISGASLLADEHVERVGRGTLRLRYVNIDWRAVQVAASLVVEGFLPEPVRLNLFPDTVVTAVPRTTALTPEGVSWAGSLEGDPLGSASLTVDGPAVSGSVRTGGRVFRIRGEGGRIAVTEIDESLLPPGAPPLQPPSVEGPDARRVPGPRLQRLVAAAGGGDENVDITFWYTQKARLEAGSSRLLETTIRDWVTATNEAYRVSGIEHRLEEVGIEEVTYTETGGKTGIEDALKWLHDSDGGAEADSRRADLLHLLIARDEDADWCGRAYVAGRLGVSGVDCGERTFAHEIGHNHGALHDRWRIQTDECDDGPPCFREDQSGDLPSWSPVYRYGYVNQKWLPPSGDTGNDDKYWRTIMAYYNQCADEGVRCASPMRFSNPNQRTAAYGDPYGVSGTQARGPYDDASEAAERGPADVARTHNDNYGLLANFFTSSGSNLKIRHAWARNSWYNPVPPEQIVWIGAYVDNRGLDTLEGVTVYWCTLRATAVDECTAANSDYETTVPPLATGESSGALNPGERQLAPNRSGTYYTTVCVESAAGETYTDDNCSRTLATEVGFHQLEVGVTVDPEAVNGTGRIKAEVHVTNRLNRATNGGVTVKFQRVPICDETWDGATFGTATLGEIAPNDEWFLAKPTAVERTAGCSAESQWIAVGVDVADGTWNTGFGLVSLTGPR